MFIDQVKRNYNIHQYITQTCVGSHVSLQWFLPWKHATTETAADGAVSHRTLCNQRLYGVRRWTPTFNQLIVFRSTVAQWNRRIQKLCRWLGRIRNGSRTEQEVLFLKHKHTYTCDKSTAYNNLVNYWVILQTAVPSSGLVKNVGRGCETTLVTWKMVRVRTGNSPNLTLNPRIWFVLRCHQCAIVFIMWDHHLQDCQSLHQP